MSAIHAVTRTFVVAAIGAAVWIAVGLVASDSRPEGVYVFLNAALPLLLAVAAWSGWRDPRRPWRWGVAVMAPIPLIHFVGSMGPVAPRVFVESASRYPADAVSFALFTVACIVASSAGAWLRTTAPSASGASRLG